MSSKMLIAEVCEVCSHILNLANKYLLHIWELLDQMIIMILFCVSAQGPILVKQKEEGAKQNKPRLNPGYYRYHK